MKPINPYLNFNGHTREAFEFYEKAFGGKILMALPFKDSPEAGKVKPEDQDKLMHISLDLGNGNILMGTDALDYVGHVVTMGNNINLSISTDSTEEADQLFAALAVDAKVTMPLAKQFWGSYHGNLTDKFGISWMISYDGR